MYCIRNIVHIHYWFLAESLLQLESSDDFDREIERKKREREISTELKDVAYPVSSLIIYNEVESILLES